MHKYRLFTPGPTTVPEATLAVLAKPVQHHRTAEFRKHFAQVQQDLQYVFQTAGPIIVITGSGTAAFEAGLTSAFAPGAKVLNVSNGKFAERWASMSKAFGLDVTELKLPYGQHVTPDIITAELAKKPYDGLIITHSETSAATACDLEKVSAAARAASPNVLIMIDGITSIGALPFKMDAWGIDMAITGSQKALMLPPGLGYVAVSDRARKAIEANKNPRNFYFDIKKYLKTIADSDTPFTPANTLVEAQAESLKMIRAYGIENIWKKTRVLASAFRAAMAGLGLPQFSAMPSDSVTAINYPAGIDDKTFRNTLKADHNVHVAGGQGDMEGKMFRVNHMGYTDAGDLLACIAAIEHTLNKLKHPVQLGTGVAIAQKHLAELYA